MANDELSESHKYSVWVCPECRMQLIPVAAGGEISWLHPSGVSCFRWDADPVSLSVVPERVTEVDEAYDGPAPDDIGEDEKARLREAVERAREAETTRPAHMFWDQG